MANKQLTVKTILVIGVNPKDTTRLRLDQEIREIENSLQRAKKRNEFTLKYTLAARQEDVRRAMLDYNPNIVHYCGHGFKESGIVFEDKSGVAKPVPSEALAAFFELFSGMVECVVLNACYSENQAVAIAQHVKYVVGIQKEISDEAAIVFTTAFYDSLGAGKPVDSAYKVACNAILFAGLPQNPMPILRINRGSHKEPLIVGDGSNDESVKGLTSYSGNGVSPDLQRDLREGRVVPFVGPGVTLQVRNRSTGQPLFPSWTEVLRQAADRLEQKHLSSEAKILHTMLESTNADYLEIAQKAREWLGASWYEFLRDQLDPDLEQAIEDSFELARAIWGFGNTGSKLIVTTNFDRVLWWACPPSIQKQVRRWTIESSAEQSVLGRQNRSYPILWHLHGNIEDAEGMILTRKHYQELYPTNKRKKIQYQAAITTLHLLLYQKTLLFIGFDLSDPYAVAQLLWIKNIFSHSISHYALFHRKEMQAFQTLKLPFEPVLFNDYDDLSELVHNLGQLATDAETATQRINKISEKFDPAVLNVILELIDNLVEDGNDPDIILKQLEEIQKGIDGGTVIAKAIDVAENLEEELSQRTEEAKDTELKCLARIQDIDSMLSDISQRRTKISTITGVHRARIVQNILNDFALAVEKLRSILKRELQRTNLTNEHWLEQFNVKQMSRHAAELCKLHIHKELSKWPEQCSHKILQPHIEAFWAEIMDEVGGLRPEAFTTRIGRSIADYDLLINAQLTNDRRRVLNQG